MNPGAKYYRWWAILPPFVLGLMALGLLFLFEPRGQSFYPVCVFHQATGWLCPGCGSLRAAHQLLHGHLSEAFRLNPLVVTFTPLLLGYLALWLWLDQRGQAKRASLHPLWWWLLLAITVGFGIWRNLPGAPFFGAQSAAISRSAGCPVCRIADRLVGGPVRVTTRVEVFLIRRQHPRAPFAGAPS